MIQIYKSTNTNFEMNGDAVLNPISCNAFFKLNGAWELELQNPLDDNFPLITEDAVLSVPTPYGEKQLYRIYKIIKNMALVIAYARPIFLDAKYDCFLFDVRPTDKTGQEALNLMVASNSKYSAKSNITRVRTAYYMRENLIAAINGDTENSFINRWGGEISYDNYEITVNERIGADNGLRAEFGYNLEEIEEHIDISNVVTRIIPISYNGHMLPDNETVDSPLINVYNTIRYAEIEYSDIKLIDDANENDAENGITVCPNITELYEKLRERAYSEYENGIDKPSNTYDVNMIDLRNADYYRYYDCMESVNLGDTVHCKHKRLGIENDSRIIELEWDCISKTIKNLILGDFKKNVFDDVSSTINSVNKVVNKNNNTLIADKISGIINLLNASLRAQKDITQKQDVRAILFEDLDIDSPTFGALSIGTQGIQIAKERNETYTDWLWGTAIDFEAIHAEFIKTHSITVDKLSSDVGSSLDLSSNESVNILVGKKIEENISDVNQIITSDYAPEDTSKIWMDISVEPHILKEWDGSAWVRINDHTADIAESKADITNEYTAAIQVAVNQLNLVVEEINKLVGANSESIVGVSNQLQITTEMAQFIKTTTETLQLAVDGKIDKKTVAEWARFDGAKLELGASNSPFKAILTSTELGFWEGDSKVAWISNKELHILKAIIAEQLGVGPFRLTDVISGGEHFLVCNSILEVTS